MKNSNNFKTAQVLLLLLILISFQRCTVKSNGQWKSEITNLELNFNENWEIIKPDIDSEDEILIGIIDKRDNSSLTVKISEDVSKEILSDESYYNFTKMQMLSENNRNELITEDEIEFKGAKFHRMILLMKTKYGKMIHTVYIHRNEEKKKITGIQFSYPEKLVDNPIEIIPLKLKEILNNMKL